MKRLITFCIMAICTAVSCCKFDDSAIWDKLNDHESRITYLEEVCKKMNTDILNLQIIVTALETNDYIVNASPLATGDGYTFIFKSGKSVVIYNGKDGVDGTDGMDGKNGIDGVTPSISVMKDIDGIYYWTVNNEWLLVNGEKVKAAASDGKDGVTPMFKIEEDYWYISYDNGTTWEKLDKATGSNGLDGINGEDGDSIFQKATQDDENVYFYLTDGTMITLRKHYAENIQFEDQNVKAICCKNWDLNNDGELSYDEASSVITITGFANTGILAFTELKYFTKLESIDQRAFYGCTSLWKISFPESLKTIDESAFENCTSILNLRIPQNVNTIGGLAFKNCNSIKTLRIDSKELLYVGGSAFVGCSGILNINCDIPNSAFSSSDFTDILIGDNVSYIGEEAFKSSTLSSVLLGSDVLEISTEAFYACKSLTKVVIPDNVTLIGEHAFAYCNSLRELTIGSSVTTIKGGAFMNASKNIIVYVKAQTPPSIGGHALYNCSYSNTFNQYSYSVLSNMKIFVPNLSVNIYKSQWSDYADKIIGDTF